MKDLIIADDKFLEQTTALINKANLFSQIITRGADEDAKELIEFKSLDEKAVAKIAKGMPEINRATNVFGKSNSQATGKLMSLNMISQSPYRRLKQCLAKIERKRSALRENIFKIRKQQVKLQRLLNKRKDAEDALDLEELGIKVEEMASNIADTNVYIEGALKEIGMYQEAYDEIKESYNIPDDWDEEDFEKCEVEEHVKTAFLHAVRDVEMTGRINVGTSEYLEQYGIIPKVAFRLVKDFLREIEKICVCGDKDNAYPNIKLLYRFLDDMHASFKDEYKHAMERIGITNLISKDFLYLEDKKGEEEDGV